MDYSDGMNLITQVSAANNAWSAEQAQKQMDFEERMSNTAHQREVADLKAAGLNPVLSAHSSGATTPTGAMGGTDTNLTSALYGLVKDAINSQMVSAQAVASVAKSASSSGKSSGSGNANAVKNAILGAFNNSTSSVQQAIEKAKFEQDREAKREDAQTQATENYKLFGLTLGPIFNAIARAEGYDNFAQIVEDDVKYALDQNKEVGKSLKTALSEASNSAKKGLEKKSSSIVKGTNKTSTKSFGNSSGKFRSSSVKTIKRVSK